MENTSASFNEAPKLSYRGAGASPAMGIGSIAEELLRWKTSSRSRSRWRQFMEKLFQHFRSELIWKAMFHKRSPYLRDLAWLLCIMFLGPPRVNHMSKLVHLVGSWFLIQQSRKKWLSHVTSKALVLEVCDETEIAELKIKVGDFEMHLKRNIGATESAMTDVSPAIPPPVSSSPMIEAAPASPPPPPPPSKSSPFIHVSPVKTSKLAALEASGASGYLIVSSPAVGSFLRSRTWKGKKQPPICKEGAMIKEGKVLAYVDQVGSQVSVIANVDGEVLKVLFEEGEAVAYGDPLFAVLPSFHDVQ